MQGTTTNVTMIKYRPTEMQKYEIRAAAEKQR